MLSNFFLIRFFSKIRKISPFVVSTIFFSCVSCSNNSNSTTIRENGDLNNSFINVDSTSQTNNSIKTAEEEKEKLLLNGWEEKSIQNGQMPECYNFKPKRGNINNYLEIHVGGGTDVSIKVMDNKTSQCVRYVFINSGTTYFIRNIPEGEYYLKIAYGKNWISKTENGMCIGKFTMNQIYEKGQELLNYNLQHTENGYNIPSFRLQLDVISSGTSNSFNSQQISEDEFNL